MSRISENAWKVDSWSLALQHILTKGTKSHESHEKLPYVVLRGFRLSFVSFVRNYYATYSSIGRTSLTHSNSGQWTRCSSMNRRAISCASSFVFTSTIA